jgi:hypothetical protein
MPLLVWLVLACGGGSTQPAPKPTPAAPPVEEEPEARDPSLLAAGFVTEQDGTLVMVPCRGIDRFQITGTDAVLAEIRAAHAEHATSHGTSYLRIRSTLKPSIQSKDGRTVDGLLRAKSISESRAVRSGDCDLELPEQVLPGERAAPTVTLMPAGDKRLTGELRYASLDAEAQMGAGLTGWDVALAEAFSLTESWCMVPSKRKAGDAIEWTVFSGDAPLGSTTLLCANARVVTERTGVLGRTDRMVTLDGVKTAWPSRAIPLATLADVVDFGRRSHGFPPK